jgi:hypothetical protein
MGTISSYTATSSDHLQRAGKAPTDLEFSDWNGFPSLRGGFVVSEQGQGLHILVAGPS